MVFLRRRFDFQNPSRMDRNVEMFMTIEKSLVQVCTEYTVTHIATQSDEYLMNIIYTHKTFSFVSMYCMLLLISETLNNARCVFFLE